MRLLVVGAHAADFVWRAGGIIAKTKELGGEVLNLSLSYGERGESGNLWKEDPNRSIESVKEARHEMSTKASDILGCTYQCLDWGDYPMLINPEREACWESPKRHPHGTNELKTLAGKASQFSGFTI